MVGLMDAIPEEFADFFIFLGYGTYGYPENAKKAESVIYDIPDLKRFDAIIIFGPGLNFQDVIEDIQKNADEAGLPVISIGLKHPGHYYIAADNYVGMKDLVDHMIEKHNTRKMVYIAGSAENEDSNIRLQAIIDSTSQHNVPFSIENDVFYSNWEAGRTFQYIASNYKTSLRKAYERGHRAYDQKQGRS